LTRGYQKKSTARGHPGWREGKGEEKNRERKKGHVRERTALARIILVRGVLEGLTL